MLVIFSHMRGRNWLFVESNLFEGRTDNQFGINVGAFVIKTIDTAFTYQHVGLASAMAVVLLAIILVVTAIQKAFFKEDK